MDRNKKKKKKGRLGISGENIYYACEESKVTLNS